MYRGIHVLSIYKGARFTKTLVIFQDVIVEILADRLRQCSNAKGIVINGFPRSIVQLGDLDKVVCRASISPSRWNTF